MSARLLSFRFGIPFILAGAAISLGCLRSSHPNRPNFVLIFCDDLGYGDIGAFGNPDGLTKNMDRMAAEGIKFTRFYVASGLCTPSRAALLTGCYPRRVSLHENDDGRGVLFPGDHTGLNPEETTLAEILRENGYSTAIIGKWHLGDQPEFLPTRHGFDYFFGLPYSNDMGVSTRPWKNYPPLPLIRNEEVIETEPDQSLLTRRYTREAVEFIESHRRDPFFLYLAHSMPHYPQSASSAFEGRSGQNVYRDAVAELDWSVGEIMKTIRSQGLEKQTLVIFTSDNGAARNWGGSNAPLRGYKASVWEGGMREPCLMEWPGQIPAGASTGELASTMDLLPTLAKLAGASLPPVHLDGKDIWPIMAGRPGARSPHESFYYYNGGNLGAVSYGRWKLHLGRYERQNGEAHWQTVVELYDLREDMAESENVAGQQQDVVRKLEKLGEEARRDLGDDSVQAAGTHVRPAGYVEDAHPLTSRGDG